MSIRAHERSVSAVYMLAWGRTNLLCVFQEAALVTQSTDQAYAHHLFKVRMDLCLVQRCWLQWQLSLDRHTASGVRAMQPVTKVLCNKSWRFTKVQSNAKSGRL